MDIDLTYIDNDFTKTKDQRQGRLLARGYHEGNQVAYLNARAKEFLELHDEVPFRLNIVQSINNALRDELSVSGFDSDEPEGAKQQAEWVNKLWAQVRMDWLQNRIHETVAAEGEAFVIVDYDETLKRPVFTFHRRFVESELSITGGNDLSGDGMGCWMLYKNNDTDQEPVAAVKQWVETYRAEDGKYLTRSRRTVYYPDKIERYVMTGNGWQGIIDEGGEFPLKWVDKSGVGLGIPVIHFKNANFSPESWEAIPLQDAINKTLIDMLGTADLSGFPMFKIFGFYPTTDGKPVNSDGSNVLRVRPMAFLGSNKPPSEASLDLIAAQSVEPLINTMLELILLAAQITNTPTSRFVVTKQIASADTLKEQERGLVKKASNRRVILGDAWEDCMQMARRLENVFGGAQMNEEVSIFTKWAKSESENALEDDKERREMEQKKLIWDTVASVVQSSQGMISPETVLRDFGWTDEQLRDFGTQRMDWIRSQQEDVIPTVTQ